LSNIRRALQKIDEGTYGLSDESGSPIPVERLEANPESLYTLDEQRSRDATR
jgi:DnaK suppressor protein